MAASIAHLEETLLATLNPATIQTAEAHLKQLSEQPGFLTVLAQVLGHPNSSPYILQAGATYFKNHIYRFWENTSKNGYQIAESEKQTIRDNIVDLVCSAPMKIKNILAVTFGRIISYDFPEFMCDDTVQRIGAHLQSSDISAVVGALMCFYCISQKYEYKNVEKGRGTYQRLIPMSFPYLLNMATIAAPMDSLEKAICCKLILKIFYATIHYELDAVLYEDSRFPEWLSLCVECLTRPIIELEDHTGKNPAKQAKKWAAQTLYQLFHRYGIPKMAPEEHKQFAKNFQAVYAQKVTEVAISVLLSREPTITGGDRPLKSCINILEAAINTSKTWKIVKNNFQEILTQALFPHLCHTEADEELWEDDQQEFIKEKLDPVAEFNSTERAAQVLLMEVTGKRADMLMPILGFCNSILTDYNNSPPESRNVRQKDGVLTIIGTLARLIEKKLAGSLEQLLVSHVFPEFQSPHGFMRFRCCWILQQFNDINYSTDEIILLATDFVLKCLRDPDLAVRVMGAVALQHVTRYEVAQERMKPHLLAVMQELINLTNQAEVDDLADVMQELVERYGEDLGHVSVEICAQLTQTFVRLMSAVDTGNEEDINKTMVSMGIIKTLCTIVTIFVDQPDMLTAIEPQLLPAVELILRDHQIDFLEDAIDVIVTCTFVRQQVSDQIWTFYPVLYNLFETECFDYFDEMMPAFDNYISFGSARFVSDPVYMLSVANMIKKVLEAEDAGEMSHIKACQLAESFVLHCRGYIDAYIPELVHLLLTRLGQETNTKVLELMLLEVLAECIICDASLTLRTMEAGGATQKFFNAYFENFNRFKRAHDLHVVIGSLCEILSLQEQLLPPVVLAGLPHIIPALLGAFALLPEAYTNRKNMKDFLEAEARGEIEDIDAEDDEEVDIDPLDLADEEDFDDEEGDEYLQSLVKKVRDASPSDDEYGSDDEEDDFGLDDEDVVIETFIDKADMYVLLRDTFKGGRGRSAESFNALVTSPEHQAQFAQLFQIAVQRESLGTLGPIN